jgi:hypothetical protein
VIMSTWVHKGGLIMSLRVGLGPRTGEPTRGPVDRRALFGANGKAAENRPWLPGGLMAASSVDGTAERRGSSQDADAQRERTAWSTNRSSATTQLSQ